MEEIPLEITKNMEEIISVLNAPPPEGITWPSISDNEFIRFHTMDRLLFARLVLLLQRHPKESMFFMAFWMHLEREYNNFTLIPAIVNAPACVVCDLAEETKLCICCVDKEKFLFTGEELFFVRNFMGGHVTYKTLHDHRIEVLNGIYKMINEVCHRAFDDILHRIFTTSDEVLGSPPPPLVPVPEIDVPVVPPRSLTPLPPPLKKSTLPHTAPPFIPAAMAAASSASSSVLPYTAPPFIPAAVAVVSSASPSVLTHTAPPFIPAMRAAAFEGYSHVTELIRCGSGPPSNEGGILGSSPGIVPMGGRIEAYSHNPFQFGNNNSNLLQMIRSEELNNAVAGQMMFLGSDLVPRQHQQAAVMGFPGVNALAMGVPAMNTVVGHPIAQWVPFSQMPTDYTAMPQQIVPPPPVEPNLVNDELIRLYMETMNFLNDEPEMDYYSVDSRTMFLTFSKGYPISEAEVYEFFTRSFGDIIESIHMQVVEENEQVLFAKIVARSPEAVDAVVLGGKAKYVINGKHIMVRKFVKKPHGEARNGGGAPPAPAPAAYDVAGPSNAGYA